MPEPLLLLRLEAPMQSWGIRARWDVRDTGPEPTKSGIIGLLGCALGLPRGSSRLADLDGDLRFSVRADRPGTIATDYHTVTGRHRMANGKLKTEEYTVQSYRDYLHDATFLVALAGGAPLLEQLTSALQHPKWPLYLGRKSCVPTRPPLDALTDDYADLADAMKRAPWSAPVDRGSRRGIARTFRPDAVPNHLRTWAGDGTWEARGPEHSLEAWIEDPDGNVERQDAIRVNDLRFYDFRGCRRLAVPVANLEVVQP
jgi:CRISPR system Cascade subunit CasD